MIIKIGTRNSKLAIAYTDQVVHALLQTNFDEQIDVDIKFIKSLGDIKAVSYTHLTLPTNREV